MQLPDHVWCSLNGEHDIFSVKIKETRTWWTVSHLKHAIMIELANSLATDAITLYRVAVDESYNTTTRNNELTRLSRYLYECTELDEKQQLSVIFAEVPPPGKMYIVLIIPPIVVGIPYMCTYSIHAHAVVSLNTWLQNLQSLIAPPSD
jgi:hypothetical protein